MKRLWAIIAAVILGGGLTLTASTPAWAVTNYFIVNWVSVHGGGHIQLACDRGKSYLVSNAAVATYNNNCEVRVWAYDPSGKGQCINPDSNASAQSAVIGRVYISTNPANC